MATRLESADQRQAYQLGLFAHYHQQGIYQSRVSFACSLSFAALGFVVIIASLAFLLFSASPETRLLRSEIERNRETEATLEQELRSLHERLAVEQRAERQATEQQSRTKNELVERASALEAEYLRVSSQLTGNVESLSLPFSFNYRSSFYGDQDAVRSRLVALQVSARQRLLKTSLAAVAVFPEHQEFLRDNITIFYGKTGLSGAVATNVGAYLQLLIPTNRVSPANPGEGVGSWRNLRRLVELVLQTSSVEEEVMTYLKRDRTPANGGYYREDEVATGLATQLESLVESFDQLHRNLELQMEFKLNPALMQGHQLIESSNRVRLQELRQEAGQLSLRIATNSAYYASLASGGATNGVERLEERLKAVREVGVQLKAKLTPGASEPGKGGAVGGQGALAILGVIAGAVIDAVAALFFVQSNRARELMVQFFDRLRRDRKLDEALGLAQDVPDAAIKSSLLRELALLLATEAPPPSEHPSSGESTPSAKKG